MSKVETKVEEIALELLQRQTGKFELVDVEYVKERDWYLRVFIDKEGGVGLDDCQNISDLLGKVLDEQGVIDNAYILEVSSPGLDRVLKKPRDYERERGKEVDVTFYAPINGEKSITGVLEGCEEGVLQLKDREPIPMDKVAQIRLHINF